jgi:4-amino-4-deoxy-L-arabinose transferase-like glycosyltransferase
MTPHRSRILLFASLIALALLTWGRIWLVEHLEDQGFFAKYYEFADRIVAGDPPRHRIGDVSPAYLWTIVAFRALGAGFVAIRNAQLIALSLAALLAAIAAKRLGGWPAAFAAAILILGNRAALVTATELEPETLILLLQAAALALVVRVSDQRPAMSAGLGLLVGLAAVSRPTALGTILLLAMWLAWRARRALLPFLIGAAIPIVTILLVNRALVGHTIIMQPGTVVYEGNNPLSTGAAGVMPRIIADLNAAGTEPDYLHVAYRLVSARATGQPLDAKLSNRYWSGKALAYLRTYPLDALELFGWKAIFAVHHYDVYDLVTTKRKADQLARWPALPFGLAVVLALTALALRERKRDLVPVAIFAVATFVALLLFTVSSRQRSAMLPALAVLGGVGVAEVIALARARSERGLLALGAILVATPILGIEGAPMREDAYNWWATLRADRLHAAAVAARERGDRTEAATYAAAWSLVAVDERPLVSAPTLRAVALDLVANAEDPPRLFDAAIALQKANAWRESAVVLRELDGYRPLREDRAVSSVAYYHARAALQLRAPRPAVDALLALAEAESPGDPHILALRSLTDDPSARTRLDAIHDPFTRDAALAAAWRDLGDVGRADALLHSLRGRFPEWRGGIAPPPS